MNIKLSITLILVIFQVTLFAAASKKLPLKSTFSKGSITDHLAGKWIQQKRGEFEMRIRLRKGKAEITASDGAAVLVFKEMKFICDSAGVCSFSGFYQVHSCRFVFKYSRPGILTVMSNGYVRVGDNRLLFFEKGLILVRTTQILSFEKHGM